MHCCISKQGSIIIPKRALEMQSKAFFSHIGGSLNNIGLLRPPFAFFCKHWVEVKLLLFGNIVNVTMTIRPWFSIVTYEFYFTICYRNVCLQLVLWFTDTQCEEFLIQVVLGMFSFRCHDKSFLRLTFVTEFWTWFIFFNYHPTVVMQEK